MDQYSLFQHFCQCYSLHYADFEGRARRRTYWGFMLYTVLLTSILLLLVGIIGWYGLYANNSSALYIAAGFWTVLELAHAVSLVPTLAVTARRLHDTGRSGWWQFLALIPFLGGLILLVWLCADSELGANRYGDHPKYPTAGEA